MNKDLMNALYVEHDGKIGVLSSDEHKVVSQVIGTDLTIVYDKNERNTYLLIPLTKNHKFECKGDVLEVDGKIIPSKVFSRKDACQWVEIAEETLTKVA